MFFGYYPYSVDIIRTFWIYPHLVDIVHILWKYPRSVDIIRISSNIRIGHITSYLARDVNHVLQFFVLVVDIICIGHITSYLDRNTCPILHIYSSIVNAWCNVVGEKCNPSPYCDIFCMV